MKTLNKQCQHIITTYYDGEHISAADPELDIEALIEAGFVKDDGDEYEYDLWLSKAGYEAGIDHEFIIRQAQDILAEFGIVPELYTWQECRDSDKGWWFNREVIATHKKTGNQLCLSAIWITSESRIQQSGSNSGVLTL